MQAAPEFPPLPPWLDIDERKDGRVPLRLPATATSDATGIVTGYLTDISSVGCRMELDELVVIGRFMTIRVVGLPPLMGWVAWQRGNIHGIDFANPLLADVVTRIVSRS